MLPSMISATGLPWKRRLRRIILCGLLLVMPACALPKLRQPDRAPELPESFATTNSSAIGNTIGCDNSAHIGVHEFYNDPTLTNLVVGMLNGNQELKILQEEVAIASNEVLARRGAYLPFVGVRAAAGFDKPSRYTRNGAVEEQLEIVPGRAFPSPLPDYLGAFTFLWRLDIWRELRNARDAAEQRYQAAIERRNFMVTRLVAEAAERYYELMALDKRLENLDKTIELQQQSLELSKAKKEAGRGTELAVQRFQAEVQKNQSEKLIVFQEIVEVENRLNFLLGRFPQTITRNSALFFDLQFPMLSVGLPAQLLQNRADIRQAERELAATGLDVLVARARFFPTLDIRANVGYQAFNPRYIVKPDALVYDLAGDLVAPLINRRAIAAEYLTANAQQLQALYNYQRTIINAYIEVVNRVSMAENYRRSLEIKKQQLDSLVASVDVATKLFQSARTEYVEVLLAQRDLMDARMEFISTKRQQLSAIVNAYQALGGGYLLSNQANQDGNCIDLPANPPSAVPTPTPPMLPNP
jgi:NodT family efflux transporter outer membrane factor (OMF) lipoprotein